MKKKMSIQRASIAVSLTAVLAFVLLVALPSVSRAMYAAPSMTQEEELVQFRQAGLHGDRSFIPVMIEALQRPPHSDYLQTSLLALAQMGATEALPAIDTVIGDNKDQNVVNFAKAARARLVAEDSAKGIKGSQAAAKVKRFYQELGLTSTSLNAGVAAYREMLRQNRASPVITVDADPPVAPVELFAMRELADMAYQSSYRADATLPDVAAVDLSLDANSALKARLSPLAHDQRVTTMLQEMTIERDISKITPEEMSKAGMGGLEEAQLLADEGGAIISTIKALQQERRTHPERYKRQGRGFYVTSGFGYLESVLVGAGDRQGVLGDRPGIALGKASQSGAKAALEKHVLRQQFVVGY